MPVNTGGAVATSCKEFFLVSDAVHRALRSLITVDRDIAFPEHKGFRRFAKEVKAQFEEPELRVIPDSHMVQFTFRFHGHMRTLSLFFRCDCDNKDWAPKSLSLSMGASGESELFVKTALHALSMLGPIRYTACNTRDEYDSWTEAPITVLQGAALRYWSPLQLDVWAEYADREFSDDSARWERFMGCSRATLRQHQTDYDSRAALVATISATPPRFLGDYHQRVMLSR